MLSINLNVHRKYCYATKLHTFIKLLPISNRIPLYTLVSKFYYILQPTIDLEITLELFHAFSFI